MAFRKTILVQLSYLPYYLNRLGLIYVFAALCRISSVGESDKNVTQHVYAVMKSWLKYSV